MPDGGEMLIRPNLELSTQPLSFIGRPGWTGPVWTEGATPPIGVQVIGGPGARISPARPRALEREGAVRAPIGEVREPRRFSPPRSSREGSGRAIEARKDSHGRR